MNDINTNTVDLLASHADGLITISESDSLSVNDNEDHTKLSWHTDKRNISELKDYHKNPRYLTKDKNLRLTKSLEKFGYVETIVIDYDNTILAGHMRVKILKKLGHKDIDARMPNRKLTEKEIEEYVILSNLLHGNFDFDILADQWEAEELVAYGFDPQDLFAGISDKPLKEKKARKPKEHECPECGCKFRN